MTRSDVELDDPCPCGSGESYKKCCLRKDRLASGSSKGKRKRRRRRSKSSVGGEPQPDERRSRRSDELSDERGETHDSDGYVVARMMEESSEETNLPFSDETGESRRLLPHTISQVAELETDRLVDQLGEFDREVDRRSFRDLAAGRLSAWGMGEEWCQQIASRPGHDHKEMPVRWHDFVCLAACELWKRWISERPSKEMLDDGIHQGYEAREAGDSEEALRLWIETWEVIRDRLPREATTLDDAEECVAGYYALFNWVRDVAQLFVDFSREDPSVVETGMTFIRQVLDQLPDADEDIRRTLRLRLSALRERSGRA